MKNILFTTNESSHGGAERMLIWLANQVSKSGKYQVFFCNLKHAPAYYPLHEDIIYICKDADDSENFLYRNTVGLFAKSSFLMKIIKKNKIDVVINFNDHAIYNILLCKLFGHFKLIVSQRVDPASIVSKTGKFRLRLIRFTDGLVCQTHSALDFFPEKLQKRSTVINNPVYHIPEQAWNDSETEKCIINVARIELKQKRQDVLLHAFSKVCRNVPDVKLKIFGSAIEEDLKSMETLIDKLDIRNNVEYCGVSDDIMSEMRKAKVFVLSSDYEGIPNAVIEAMSLGMPIVSTDCKPGGARMLLEDGSGLLTPIGDSEKLAEAIEELLVDKNKAVDLGKRARISVKRFDENKIALKWIKYFDKIIQHD